MNIKTNIHKIFIFTLLFHITMSNIQANIVKLVPSGYNMSTYTLQNTFNRNIVISLSSFSSIQTNTSCQTVSSGSTFKVQCTSNIESFSYLLYADNVMIYSSTYTMYYFDKDYRTQVQFPVQLGHKYIQKPVIRAFIQGYQQINSLQSFIHIYQEGLNSSLQIKRSLNIRKLKFTYLVIQNSPLYNVSFTYMSLSFDMNHQLTISNNNLLNFLGINKISFRRQSIQTPITLNILSYISPSNPQRISTFSINQFVITSQTQISTILLSLYESTSCNNSYFNTSSNICQTQCQSNKIYKDIKVNPPVLLCVNKNIRNNISISVDNYRDIQLFNPLGCIIPIIKEYSTVICLICQSNYINIDNQCLCGYKLYNNSGRCYLCQSSTDNNCIPHSRTQTKILQNSNLNTIDVQIIYYMPNIVNVKLNSSNDKIFVNINDQTYAVKLFYNRSQNTLKVLVQNVPISAQYTIQIIQSTQNSQKYLYIIDDYGSYLWIPTLQKTILYHPISNRQIIQSIAPIFTNSQKTVPIITTISFAIGQKINILGIYQTVSILYLINFINLHQNYKDLGIFIKEMFIFQPAPMLKIFGKDGLIKVNNIDDRIIKINNQIQSYTKGQSYISLGLNNIILYSLQVIILFIILKFLKYLLSPSKNTILPQLSSTHQRNILNDNYKLRRSYVNKYNKICWLSQPQLNQSSTLRQKIYYKIYLLNQKKWIIATSLISVQIVSHSFLILQELLVPIYDATIMISHIISFLVLLFILIYPIVLINLEPLYVLKCTLVIYKRRNYTMPQLWVLFYYYYIESVIFTVIILITNNGQIQTGLISLLLLIKMVVFRYHLKNIQLIKQILIFLFFFINFLTFHLPNSSISHVKSLILIIVICILSCQFFKLFRSILILFINLFKSNFQSKVAKLIVQQQKNKENDKNITNYNNKLIIKVE